MFPASSTHLFAVFFPFEDDSSCLKDSLLLAVLSEELVLLFVFELLLVVVDLLVDPFVFKPTTRPPTTHQYMCHKYSWLYPFDRSLKTLNL